MRDVLGAPSRSSSISAAAPSRRPRCAGCSRTRATVVWLDVDVETAWQRVRGQRPPARAGRCEASERLYEERRPLYAEVADVVARDVDDVVLAAAGVHVERGALQRLGELVPGEGAVALVSDPHVAGIHGMDAQLALGSRLARDARAAAGRGGEDARGGRPALAGAAPRPERDDRRARRRLHDRCRRLRGRDVPPRHRLDARADEPRRPGRRGDRRQDGDRPAAGQEPRRRLPLAGPDGGRPGAARDAARAAAARGHGGGREGRPARG